MKRIVLTGVIAAVMPFGVLRAATPEFVDDGRDSASAEEVSSPSAESRAKIDPGQQNGILFGQPFFRFDPKYGDICLQTVFGKVNGAQVHVTF